MDQYKRLKLSFSDGTVFYLPAGVLAGTNLDAKLLTAEWETRDSEGCLEEKTDALVKW